MEVKVTAVWWNDSIDLLYHQKFSLKLSREHRASHKKKQSFLITFQSNSFNLYHKKKNHCGPRGHIKISHNQGIMTEETWSRVPLKALNKPDDWRTVSVCTVGLAAAQVLHRWPLTPQLSAKIWKPSEGKKGNVDKKTSWGLACLEQRVILKSQIRVKDTKILQTLLPKEAAHTFADGQPKWNAALPRAHFPGYLLQG